MSLDRFNRSNQILGIDQEIRRLEKRLKADKDKFGENYDEFAFGDGAIIRDELMNRYEKRIKETEERLRTLRKQMQDLIEENERMYREEMEAAKQAREQREGKL